MVYFAQLPTGSIKIGYSSDVNTRMDQLRGHYGAEPSLLLVMDGDRETEAEMHQRFAHLRLGRTEQFKPGPDLMAFIGRPLLVSPNPEAVEAIEATSRSVRVRVAGEWAAWLERAAKHCRTDIAKLIDAAVADYVKARGFSEEPPERVP